MSDPTPAPTGVTDAHPTTGELPALPRDPAVKRRRPLRFSLKVLAFVTVLYYFVVPLIPGFRSAAVELQRVQPALLAVGLALELSALFCYSLVTRAALGDAGSELSRFRLFRIQMSMRAMSGLVPGGNAAGSALGYRLLTLSGVRGADAGFALATAGIASAVVLNLLLWTGLFVSIPIRGVNRIYGTAALGGVLIMGLAGMLVYGVMAGEGRAERFIRWAAAKIRLDPERAAAVLHRIAERLDQLLSDRQILGRVATWSALYWLLDASALWVFLRAFNVSMAPDALIISFGIANVLAAIPITPGGLGYVDGSYIAMLTGFGAPARQVTLGLASYRFAQFFFPILLGGILYLTLRVGPWSIERRERLVRLRDLAEEETRRGESTIDFQLRFPTRDETGELIRRPPATPKERVQHHQERFRRWRKTRKQ